MENSVLCVQMVLFHLSEHFNYPNTLLHKGVRISEDALNYDPDIDHVVNIFYWDNDGTYM